MNVTKTYTMPLITKRKDVQEDSKDRNTRMHRIYQFIYNADNTFGDGIPNWFYACRYLTLKAKAFFSNV
jgi:hypothetical protein